jgi:hypothetical protein
MAPPGAAGRLYHVLNDDVALYPMDTGNYTTFPGPNPVSTIGARGTGAKMIYTYSKVAAGGSGYQVGDVLRVSGDTSTQLARVIVTSVGGGGAVTVFEVIDGRGYSAVPSKPVSCAADMVGGSICGNIISDTREGPAIVLYDQAMPLNGRMWDDPQMRPDFPCTQEHASLPLVYTRPEPVFSPYGWLSGARLFGSINTSPPASKTRCQPGSMD